ncbi:hypothetical protein CP10743SC13_0016 [Chlamydia psittaci 10_743_SC13]|nr:hypothetical protein CP10743SC13_0016 [Chlamydia psittaci 10_743_SC13]
MLYRIKAPLLCQIIRLCHERSSRECTQLSEKMLLEDAFLFNLFSLVPKLNKLPEGS